MDIQTLLPLITGSAGALIVLTLVLYGLYKLANKVADRFLIVMDSMATNMAKMATRLDVVESKVDQLLEDNN